MLTSKRKKIADFFSQKILAFASDILFYLWDMFDLGMLLDFDEGTFQAHLEIGKSIVARGHNKIKEIKTLAEKLDSKLSMFNVLWQRNTGLSMENLWQIFKPCTAKTTTELNNQIQVEKLANQFDQLKWSTGVSYRNLDIVRQSLVGMYHHINSIDIISNDQFQVSYLRGMATVNY